MSNPKAWAEVEEPSVDDLVDLEDDPLAQTVEFSTDTGIPSGSDPSVNLLSDGFHASVFLSAMHGQDSYNQLVQWREKLKQAMELQKGQLKELVKSKFDKFVQCKDKVEWVGATIRQKDFSGREIGDLEDDLHHTQDAARKAFDGLLERKDSIDGLKHAQTILKQFRFLLDLPAFISDAIRTKEYNKVVHAYKRFKQYRGQLSLPLFEQVMEELEQLVEQCRELLFRSLEDPRLPWEEHESAIKVLVDLDAPEDPAWYHLQQLRARIIFEISNSAEHHAIRVESIMSRAQHGISAQSNAVTVADPEIATSSIRLIRKLTSILSHSIPDLKKLSDAYFAGKYGKSLQHLPSDFTVEIAHIMQVFSRHVAEALHLPRDVSSLSAAAPGFFHSAGSHPDVPPSPTLSRMPSMTALPSVGLPAHVRECVLALSSCHSTLVSANVSEPHLLPFTKLLTTARRLYVLDLCSKAADETAVLIEVAESLTGVVSRVRRSIITLISAAKAIVPDGHHLVAAVSDAAFDCIRILCDSLHRRGFPELDSQCSLESLSDVLSAVLSASNLLLASVCSSLSAAFPSCELSSTVQKSRVDLAEILALLQDLLCERIVRVYTIDLSYLVRSSVLGDGVDLLTVTPPSGIISVSIDLTHVEIRPYILTILLRLVFMFGSLRSTDCSALVLPLVSRVIQHTLQTFAECVGTIEKISTNAALQIQVDLKFFESSLGMYFQAVHGAQVRQVTDRLQHIIVADSASKPGRTEPSQRLLTDLVSQTRTHTAALLECFTVSVSE